MSKIAVGTVVYPGVEVYIKDFLNSMNKQTIDKMDLIIINDNFDNLRLKKELKSCEIKTILLDSKAEGIVANRIQLIEEAILRGYDSLVFADSDDYSSNERVECLVRTLNNGYGIAYNDIEVIGSSKNYFNNQLPDMIADSKDIIDYNFIGLGNSAIDINKAKNVINETEFDNSVVVFDWYFYTILLNNGLTAHHSDCGVTHYRIHDENIAGDKTLNEKKLLSGLKIKKLHYHALTNIWPELYKTKLKEVELFEKVISVYGKEKYIHEINAMNLPFWWQNIKTDYL